MFQLLFNHWIQWKWNCFRAHKNGRMDELFTNFCKIPFHFMFNIPLASVPSWYYEHYIMENLKNSTQSVALYFILFVILWFIQLHRIKLNADFSKWNEYHKLRYSRLFDIENSFIYVQTINIPIITIINNNEKRFWNWCES